MAHITGCLVALLVLVAPAAALAQESSPTGAERPRLEVGGGVGWFFSGGTMPYDTPMIDGRVGVRLSRNWSLEGLVHVKPGSGTDIDGYYRAQILWRIGKGKIQPFLAFGGAGEFSRSSWPEYRYNDSSTGEPRVIPAGSHVSITAPWYPTAAVGFEKVLASRLIVRAELTTAYAINDYGIAVAFLPSASVSIPIGRYRTASR